MVKILVTGATGFIGSNLVPKLLKENHEIYCPVRYVSNRELHLPKDVNSIFCDLRDSVVVKKIVKDIKPEIIIHLAAASSVELSHLHSQEFIDTNLNGTINLGLASLELSTLEKFIFAGSSEEYGNQELIHMKENPFPIKETAPLVPNQPYSISKVACDHFLNYLYLSYKIPLIIARPFNTYGRINNFNFITEKIIVQMLRDTGVTLGNPEPIRDFLYLDDHVNAYLTLVKNSKILEKIGSNRAINFCTGNGITIKDWASLIGSKLRYDCSKINWTNLFIRPTEVFKLLGDNSKAKELLGWEPRITQERGIELAIKHIKEHGF